MNEESLASAFSDSLKSESISSISEFAEIGLDSVMEEGILKKIPIASTVASLYKIGRSIKDRYNLKQLMVFLNEINYGIVNEDRSLILLFPIANNLRTSLKRGSQKDKGLL